MKTFITAPHGTQLHCKGWHQEAAMRMLMNNLDPQVAEDPDHLIVYGGSGKAARNWESYHQIIECLKQLENNQTLLIQSGKPVGILPTHEMAPRVIIANSLLVPAWATWDEFRRLEKLGLIMYGQMTAGSWIYIGTQGILQGTYETFAAAAQTHYQTNHLQGKWVLTAGLGGMGGAQPLAVTLNGGVALVVEVDPKRIQRRLELKYCDRATQSLDEALNWCQQAVKNKQPLSVALEGNAADIYSLMAKQKITPDFVTDQTSAHDALNGYIPTGLDLNQALKLRQQDPQQYVKRAMQSMAQQVDAMLAMQNNGSHVFDYGNNIRAQAHQAGIANAFDFPGFVPAYIRPLFCQGKGPFRWAALSGDPQDIYYTDAALMEAFPHDAALKRWLTRAKKAIPFQGLPARICWLGYGEREKAGLIFNQLVRQGKVKAPLVIGRDHLDAGSVASPNRETEQMRDGSDAIADWPILNSLINAINGASWVSVHHGGGVGIGYSIHAGMVCLADGTQQAEKRLHRVLNSDPAMGVIRHADAGYPEAIQMAKNHSIQIPGLN